MTDKDFEKIYNESDKLEQVNKTRKQLYAVIRQADGSGFKSSSYAKVVDASILKPTDLSTIAMFGDKRVYVQNVGDKYYCEQIEKRIKSILDYRNIGEDW